MQFPVKKKILMFNLAVDENDPILGFAVPLIVRMAREAEEVHIITVRTGSFTLPSNVFVRSVRGNRGMGKIGAVISFYGHLFGVLRAVRIDVCFSHMNPLFVVLAAPVLAARRIRIVLWYAHHYRGLTARIAHIFAWRIVTSGRHSYSSSGRKVVVTGQMVDTDFFTPTVTSHVPIPGVFVSAGRIAPIKDLLTFVRAAGIMRDKGLRFRCVCIGPVLSHDAGYYASLREEIKTLSLGDIFSFAGPVAYREMPKQYGVATAHVNLCATGALDKAALEAMACGTPSVFANQAFVPLVGPAASALSFPFGDARRLAEVLAGFLVAPTTLSGADLMRLREKVVREHSLRSFVGRLVTLLS